LPNGSILRILPTGIQHSVKTKSILGNGVIIDAKHLLNDLRRVENNGIDIKDRLYVSNRAHIETILHKKVAHRLREIRNDSIWINGEDIATAFKPMKMGLRVAHLAEPWETFLEKYQRVRSTYEELYRINLTEQEVADDLEQLRLLQSVMKKYKMIQDTVVLLNQEIRKGKRILAEDCSSSLMDVDFGIYPYTDSYNTTTGAVCTGLGVPEEAIETTIGVISATSLMRRSFMNRIQTFPSQVRKGDDP
jgi:adenylosuccinate synthase